MTLQEKLEEMLVERGFFPDQAMQVMDAVKAVEDISKSMANRWNHSPADYPPRFIDKLWLRVSAVALDWIDENMPLAFFRPLFVEGS